MNLRHQVNEWETCVMACGNSWHMLKEIEGRYSGNDFVVKRNRSIEQITFCHIWVLASKIAALDNLCLKGIFGAEATAKI